MSSLTFNGAYFKLSKALDRSVKRVSNTPPLSKLFFIFLWYLFFIINPLRNPHWCLDEILSEKVWIWLQRHKVFDFILNAGVTYSVFPKITTIKYFHILCDIWKYSLNFRRKFYLEILPFTSNQMFVCKFTFSEKRDLNFPLKVFRRVFYAAQRWSFPWRISSINLTKTAYLVLFTEEILNGKIHFLCSVKIPGIVFFFFLN